jgi:two-component system sensor kinase FixL
VPNIRETRFVPYVAAIAAVAVAYGLRLLANPILHGEAPFLLFVLPVVLTVLTAGRGPAILAGALSLVAGFSVIREEARFAAPALVQASMFVLVCACLGWLDSRRTRQRDAARQADRQLELLVDQVESYAIFMVDDASLVRSWNAGAERILGWRKDQVIGQHSSMFLAAPFAHELAMTHLEQARRDGRFTDELWQRRADGSEFLATISITPIFDAKGASLGFAKIVSDTTARKAEELALQRREEHLRSILATVPHAMVVIDEHGIVLSFSAAAERLFGYAESEVTGRNVSMLMPSPDREKHDGYIARYLASGVPKIIGIGRIVTGLRADGSTFPMHLSVGEALAGDQRLFTGFVQDLSEKQAIEARLSELQAELIHVSRLSAMGTMASTLAHELNQPLTAIASYGEAAEAVMKAGGELDRAMLGEVLGEMAAQALRAGGIVRRLREFVTRGELTKSVEDLPKLIEDTAALALVGSKESNVRTEIRLDPSAPSVLVDRVQIQQVLINLIRNAIEAMQGCSERRLMITTRSVDGQMVEVSVSDTGHGITPPVRERLFEAFNTSKDSGMGLGLSICRTIVEAHGGKISASERPGGGSVFRFTLMRSPSEEELGA